jgi:hypothetical protein
MQLPPNIKFSINKQIVSLTKEIKNWAQTTSSNELKEVTARIQFFNHVTSKQNLTVCSVDGSGDFPAIQYLNSFIYLSVAQAVQYKTNALHGLKEYNAVFPVAQFTWIPEQRDLSESSFDEAFEQLSGESVMDVIEQSDYRTIKEKARGKKKTLKDLHKTLIRPEASDAGNIGIQLSTTSKLGLVLKAINEIDALDYLLIDSTLSLPLIYSESSLFFEHLKRLCCLRATERKICLLSISKSPAISSLSLLEKAALDKTGKNMGVAEHWYLRLPTSQDNWEFDLSESKNLPPQGAVTYLFRLHQQYPVMRLDIDEGYWNNYIYHISEKVLHENEQKLFEDIDYMSHDQRCYGYPYPLQAAQARTNLRETEKNNFRQHFVDIAVQNGLDRKLFQYNNF